MNAVLAGGLMENNGVLEGLVVQYQKVSWNLLFSILFQSFGYLD